MGRVLGLPLGAWIEPGISWCFIQASLAKLGPKPGLLTPLLCSYALGFHL